jgi:hypothetical protein
MANGKWKIENDPHAKSPSREEMIYKTISADFADYTDSIIITPRRGAAKKYFRRD